MKTWETEITKANATHLLDSPIASREGGHVVLGAEMIAATTDATVENGWLWTKGQHSAHMANGGEMNVFPPEWAEILVRLRSMDRHSAEAVLSTEILTDRGSSSVARLLCDTYRAIRKCDPVKVSVLDRDKHDESDIGETKLVVRFSRPVVEKIAELIA